MRKASKPPGCGSRRCRSELGGRAEGHGGIQSPGRRLAVGLAELAADVEVVDLDISLDTDHYEDTTSPQVLGIWSDAWEGWRIEDLEARPLGEDRLSPCS